MKHSQPHVYTVSKLDSQTDLAMKSAMLNLEKKVLKPENKIKQQSYHQMRVVYTYYSLYTTINFKT
ncbi:hypothetical protein SAMN04488027_101180 [Psychroflexus sediminis]|uniref:Uncharacterized protein n=1 Tax=Psychroflexus sediminis TaxID=470826 RepID=A0A1G7U1B9_9FLAO|nr:hypothetical protein SAMN04488027_101180 [Psychroflexus sediminis]